jgi:uncharacterized protein (TIGR00730 family)
MAANNIELVYGAGNVGLMGVVADRMLEHGMNVIGVIPQHLVDREVGHTGLPDLRVVETMHERKMLMADLSDAFIAMPGGIGTIEEIVEVMCWNQIGVHAKPCGFLNVEGFYDPFFTFLDHTVSAGFVKASHRSNFLLESEPELLLKRMAGLELTKEFKIEGRP